jgi:hypothetical protein
VIAQVYYEGYWEALEGQPREANPYEGTPEAERWRSWDDGWEDAQAEFAVSER